ncbi:MAG: polymer-forming cytoskeletal protein [gamma proteobacterium symbiont of Taylorina sp.]|nr:polymer-forming cytoskeletal protein [gamma proteobacterium symbiont of Taylorina sp.]
MWGSKKKVNKNISSLIGHDTKIIGDIDFTGGLLIEGKIIGNITAHDDDTAMININNQGYVQGEIQIPNIVINGTVEGSVYANNHIELAKNARIHGNVYYNLIEMAMGAEVNGNLVHITEESMPEMISSKNEPARLESTELTNEV